MPWSTPRTTCDSSEIDIDVQNKEGNCILLVHHYTGSRVARRHTVLGCCNAGLNGIKLSGSDVAMDV